MTLTLTLALTLALPLTPNPHQEHAFFTSDPAWEWEGLLIGRLAPPPLPWDKACPSSHARNCHGEYRFAPIAAERAVAKWSEVPLPSPSP